MVNTLTQLKPQKKKLGKPIFKDQIVKEITSYKNDKELIIQKQLWKINPPIIITTNFDTLIEDSIKDHISVITPLHKSELADLLREPKDSKILFKIHGSIKEFESLIFTKEDYNNLYVDAMDAYQLTFTTSLLKHNLLFIGFSLQDEAIINILSTVKEMFNGFSGTHYALLKKNEVKTKEFWDQCNIKVIEYENHNDIDEFIFDVEKLLNPSKTHNSFYSERSRTNENTGYFKIANLFLKNIKIY